jgi:hypothetical protein
MRGLDLHAGLEPRGVEYGGRVIGTLRRECLDHGIAVNERQVQRVVDNYRRYYNRNRPRLALAP